MKRKQWISLILFLSLLTACATPQPSTPVPDETNKTAVPPGSELPQGSYAPTSGDQSKQRGDVSIDSLAIRVQNSFPPSYMLDVKGSLPTPCHNLREVVDQPGYEDAIRIQIYSVYDPYTACAQVVQPFETSIPLGSYVRGSHAVFVNGHEVGKIVP